MHFKSLHFHFISSFHFNAGPFIVSVTPSINQSINLYRAIIQRRVLQCGYAESKRNVLRRPVFAGVPYKLQSE